MKNTAQGGSQKVVERTNEAKSSAVLASGPYVRIDHSLPCSKLHLQELGYHSTHAVCPVLYDSYSTWAVPTQNHQIIH